MPSDAGSPVQALLSGVLPLLSGLQAVGSAAERTHSLLQDAENPPARSHNRTGGLTSTL